MLLVKNAEVYAPEYLGKKDLLICGGKIECIQDSIGELPVECEILDAEGKILTPGFLDQHVHITGGGGEGSFHVFDFMRKCGYNGIHITETDRFYGILGQQSGSCPSLRKRWEISLGESWSLRI